MMDTNLIIQQEVMNDGQSVFLHYEPILGLYLAFGFSAYYADMVTEPYLSYSEELQMPVALLDRMNILDLRQSMRIISHASMATYHFETRVMIGDAGYERWVKKIHS